MQLLIRTPTRHYFVSIFIIVSTLFLAFSVVIYRHYAEAQRLNEWTLYNYELMRQSRKILFDIVSMETGVRGYLLTGKKSFLDPYEDSRKMLAKEIKDLWEYTKNDPNTHEDIDQWLKKIEHFSDGLNRQMEAFRASGKRSVSQLYLEQQKREMDGLRTLLESFIHTRLTSLQKQINISSSVQGDFKYILAIGTVLAIGGMFLVIWLFLALIKRSQKAEDAARTLEDRFQTVMNGVNDGLYDYDIEAGTIYYSPSYKAMLGYTEDEFTNTVEASHNLIHPDDFERTMETVRLFVEGTSPAYSNVFRMRHKDGSWMWILSRGVGLKNRNGKIARIIGTHTDITEQKGREEELRQLNSEMETFTYITSHDLRAPLVNLKGFASEMEHAVDRIRPIIHQVKSHVTSDEQDTLKQALDEDIPESLRFIEQSVDRMDSLTTAVLDLSRIGKREYRFEPVNAQAVVQRCLDTLAYEISQNEIEIVCEELPSVVSDPLALEQIFSNILDNAVKYLDPSRKKRIVIAGKQTGNDIIFSIQDNGRGIAAVDREKVFQIFRRARNTIDVRGMGMGMTFVQATLRRLGGTIWFESSPGIGTTFYFSLPKHIKPRMRTL